MKNLGYFFLIEALLYVGFCIETNASPMCNCGAEGHETDCCWEINNGVLTISAATGATNVVMKDYTWSTLEGSTYPNSYLSSAPWANQGVTSVNIGDNIKTVGKFAFIGESKITNISGMNDVSSINAGAFQYMTGMKAFTIPKSVTDIELHGFLGSGIKSLVIPDSVKSIGYRAFESMNGLKSLTIPDSIQTIGERAFQGIKLSSLAISSDMLLRYLNAGGLFNENSDFDITCTSGDCTEIIKSWDAANNTSYLKHAKISARQVDGTVVVYKNGKIIGYKGKRIYTVNEATAVSGEKNMIKIRYK